MFFWEFTAMNTLPSVSPASCGFSVRGGLLSCISHQSFMNAVSSFVSERSSGCRGALGLCRFGGAPCWGSVCFMLWAAFARVMRIRCRRYRSIGRGTVVRSSAAAMEIVVFRHSVM